MKNALQLWWVIIPLLVSCTKVETEPIDGPQYTNTVTGYLRERGTNAPLANTELEVNCLQGSYTNIYGGYALSTDSTGRYEVVYSGPSQGRMKVSFPGTAEYGSASTEYFQPYTQKTADLISAPFGWIKFHIKNINLWDGNDRIGINLNGTPQNFYGMVDKIAFEKRPGNGMNTISWAVQRAGVTTSYKDSIFVPGFDTVSYNIHY